MDIAWKPKLVTNSSKNDDYFHDLSMGYVPALIIPNIINNEECQRITSRILSANQTSSGLGITKKIGESLNSYLHNKIEYFKNAKLSNQILKKLFLKNDPRNIMMDEISKLFGKRVEFAKEKSMLYSTGVIRLHLPGDSIHIHRDNANFEASDFAVSKLSTQMSAVLHFQPAKSGGELKIFRKLWQKNDERFRNPYFGYSEDVVNGIQHTSIKSNPGDLVMINPRLYHMVDRVKGKLERISFGFFFGQDVNSNLYAWS